MRFALPSLPKNPEFEELRDVGAAQALVRGFYAVAHHFAAPAIVLRRNFADDYAGALQQYMTSFWACSWFADLAREGDDAQRSRHVQARRTARSRLDKLGKMLPHHVHAEMVAYAVMGGAAPDLRGGQ